MKKIFGFLFLLTVFYCSKDEFRSYFLSVIANTGGTVSILASEYDAEGKYVSVGKEYSGGKIVDIRATPDDEYRFVSWSNGETKNPLSVVVDKDIKINANFQKAKYNLIISTYGKGSVLEEVVSLGRNTDPRYNSGSVVRLTANAAYGYRFVRWDGDLTSNDNPVELNIDSAKSIIAVFELIMVDLEIITQGQGSVSQELMEVTSSNKNTTYNYGDTVRLSPQPEEGHDFISWSSDHVGEENPLEISLTESKTIQANFDFELFNRSVGKWKIRKKTENKLPSWDMHSIIFRRNYTYTINSNSGQINGAFNVISNSEIDLTNYGSITGVELNSNDEDPSESIGNTLNFNLSVPGEFEGQIESEADENYESEVSETGEVLDKTYVPDDNFEQTLINLGYDDVLDDYVNTSAISGVQQLNNSDWVGTISDLTGVEDFVSLTSLQADNMEVSQVDISNNIYLENLSIHSNNLTELDLSNNINLRNVIINDNQIEYINLENNSFLEWFIAGNNILSSIDLSNNSELLDLRLDGNRLTELNISNNTKLKELNVRNSCSECSTMQISSIDLSNNLDLEVAQFYRNPLTSIDVSNNPNLKLLDLNDISTFNGVIDFSNNLALEEFVCSCNISYLDLSNNTELTSLSLSYNSLTQIDISNNLKLDQLNLFNNNLNSLDVSSNNLLLSLNTQNNSDLECINVSENQLNNIPLDWMKDQSTLYSTECDIILQKTTILDNNFEQALIDMGLDDIIDNEVLTNNINQITNLDLTDKNIIDLTGIQDFSFLESISANTGNQIQGVLDLSSNTNLNYVDLANNQLSELYLNNNPNLTGLFLYHNTSLSVLEIGNSPILETLTIHDNLITELNLSNSPKIKDMRIWNSKLESFDLSNQTELEILRAQSIFKTEGKSIDLSNNSSLKIIDLRNNFLESIDLSSNSEVEIVVLSENKLSSIDLSNNSQIRILGLQVNNINSLDLSSINNLTLFRGFNNDFTCVTLSETQINNIPQSCQEIGIPDNSDDPNQETCYGWELNDLSESYDYTPTWVVEQGVSYSINCDQDNGKTYVPDDNFEQALIELGYDDVLDDYVNTIDVQSITNLDIRDRTPKIVDLTGIESFSSLEILNVTENSVVTLNLSDNINLVRLDADNNSITAIDVSNSPNINFISAVGNEFESIDLSGNPLLEELYIDRCNISSIDLSNNSLLTYLTMDGLGTLNSIDLSNNTLLKLLRLEGTQLDTIDLSTNVNLEELVINNNKLTSLDLSTNSKLKILNCASQFADPQASTGVLNSLNISNSADLQNLHIENNSITSLDLSNNTNITELNVSTNPLTALDVSGLTNLQNFWATVNGLECIQVNQNQLDNTPNTWDILNTTSLSIDCD